MGLDLPAQGNPYGNGVEVEVLTVPDCPHRAEAITRVRDALAAAEQVGAVVAERVVATVEEAAAAGMRGSPTILIDGRDPFLSGTDEPSLSCRLYRSAAGVEGAPAITALVEALSVSGDGAGDG
jgi:hypothetical protein